MIRRSSFKKFLRVIFICILPISTTSGFGFHFGTSSKELLSFQDKTNATGPLLDLKRYPKLKSLDVSHCKNLKVLANLSSCKELTCIVASDSGLITLDLAECPQLERLWIKGCKDLTKLKNSAYSTKLRYLDASEAGITTLDLSKCATLEELKVCRNKDLTTVTLPTDTNNLVTIDASETSLLGLNLSNCLKLNRLDVYKCEHLAEVENLGACKNLSELIVSCTPVREIDLSGCASLFTQLQADNCTHLEELKGSHLCSINLRLVRVSNTALQKLDFSNCSHIAWLYATHCKALKSINIPQCIRMEVDVTESPEITRDAMNIHFSCKITGWVEKIPANTSIFAGWFN